MGGNQELTGHSRRWQPNSFACRSAVNDTAPGYPEPAGLGEAVCSQPELRGIEG